MFNDFDDANDVLNTLAEQGIIERMVEPIDDPSLQTNYWDWAETIGIVDDLVPMARFHHIGSLMEYTV
jgi:hypothetical protein